MENLPSIPRWAWIDRFTIELRRIRPGLDEKGAVEVAEACHSFAGHREPEATVFAFYRNAPRVDTDVSIVLTEQELVDLTRYKRATLQLKFLQSRGFNRAVIHQGVVLLERVHYVAIATGMPTHLTSELTRMLNRPKREPQLRP